MFIHPRQKLHNLNEISKHLWVVAYVNQEGNSPLLEQAFADVENAFEGGANAVVLINEWCSLQELESTLSEVRKRYPTVPLGVNYLGDDSEPFGYKDSFRLARDYQLQVVWTDFSGVDLINEKPDVDLHKIAEEKSENFFYCSGIHMKYSTLKNSAKSIEQSALQAMGWVDGVIVTGPKTGVPVDRERVQSVRRVLGNYPLGVASGVSAENVHKIRDEVDFFLVASSLQNEYKRIVGSKVRELRQALNER